MSSLADRHPASAPLEQRQPTAAPQPFLGLVEAVTVEDPVLYPFDGSILRKHAQTAWIWASRDLCPDLLANVETMSSADLDALMPQVVIRMRDGLKQAEDHETGRRLRAQLGGPEALERLPFVINALHSRALLVKAEAFGKAANTIDNDHTLGAALQAMPLQDASATALLMHVAIGQISNPTRLVTTALRIAGGGSEAAIQRSGFAPMVDAILAHAQNQLHALQQNGPFADVDMTCRALDRLHKLIRSLTGYVEFARNSRWTMVLAALTKHTSDRIEQRLKDVVPDLNQALRKMPGTDRLDHDRLLSALNGMYVLAAVRDSRDSLAVNALFDQAWSQSGEALELHLVRNLELYKLNPDDALIGTRLDTAIKMAEIRFTPEYAETLRRARHTAERRA
jgi:hypothetical protein